MAVVLLVLSALLAYFNKRYVGLPITIVGLAMWAVLPLTGLHLPLLDCLLFGALISPTNPIAVMGILKSAGAPKDLELALSLPASPRARHRARAHLLHGDLLHPRAGPEHGPCRAAHGGVSVAR